MFTSTRSFSAIIFSKNILVASFTAVVKLLGGGGNLKGEEVEKEEVDAEEEKLGAETEEKEDTEEKEVLLVKISSKLMRTFDEQSLSQFYPLEAFRLLLVKEFTNKVL